MKNPFVCREDGSPISRRRAGARGMAGKGGAICFWEARGDESRCDDEVVSPAKTITRLGAHARQDNLT